MWDLFWVNVWGSVLLTGIDFKIDKSNPAWVRVLGGAAIVAGVCMVSYYFDRWLTGVGARRPR